MKKSTFFILCIFLFSHSIANAQAFGCTNTDHCNMICNPLLEETGPGECEEDVTILFQDAFECVPGWRLLYGSIDHAQSDAMTDPDYDFSGHPSNDLGSLMIAAYSSTEIFDTEAVGTPFDMDPNTDYLLTFSIADAAVPDPSSTVLAPADGGNHDLITAIPPSLPTVQFHYPSGTILGSNGGPEFRNDAVSIYQNENIDVTWSQKFTCFNTGQMDFDLLFFEYLRPIDPPASGGPVWYMKIDQIELIEDRFINNSAGISEELEVQCGFNVNVGTELCTVTGIEYQIWDITDSSNEFQLTGSTSTNAYTVNSIDGAAAQLGDVVENVNLQIRRVFLPAFDVPIDDHNCDATLDISITAVDCCDADPWPRIYEGPNYLAPTNLGIEFDGFGNVYVLRANTKNGSSYGISSMDLIKYCEDGELLWSTPLEQTLLSGWRPNTRLAVDKNGNAYVLSMYRDAMSAGGIPINNPGHNIVILKFDSSGALIADRSISYPETELSDEYESIKVNDGGTMLYVLLNDRIKRISPVTLGDIFDREGFFHSIDINTAGTDVFYLSNDEIGAFIGGLNVNPITANLEGVPHSKTDFEYDEMNKRFYVVVKDFRLYVYRLNPNSINLLLTIPQCIKNTFYNEIHPVQNGVLVYNPVLGQTKGYTGPEHLTFYNLGGDLQWNLVIDGFTTLRTPNMLNVNGNLAYLGANWTKSLNMGWYSSSGASGSFVSRINMTTGTYGFIGDWPSELISNPSIYRYSSQAQIAFEDEKDSKLTLYPNPTTSDITLDYEGDVDADYSLAIYDWSGRLILEETGTKWTTCSFGNWELFRFAFLVLVLWRLYYVDCQYITARYWKPLPRVESDSIGGLYCFS